jgi:hypothetical protein
MDCLPQGDFRPAETHRDPSGDQLHHKLAGDLCVPRSHSTGFASTTFTVPPKIFAAGSPDSERSIFYPAWIESDTFTCASTAVRDQAAHERRGAANRDEYREGMSSAVAARRVSIVRSMPERA